MMMMMMMRYSRVFVAHLTFLLFIYTKVVWHERTVRLDKRVGQGLGLTIKGGALAGGRVSQITVVGKRPNTAAAECNRIHVGDRLLAANGVLLQDMLHKDVVELLRNQGPVIELRVISQVVELDAGAPDPASRDTEAAARSPDPTAPSSRPQVPSEEARQQAQALKEHGNQLMQAQEWQGAAEAYTQAIALDPTVPAFFCNRSAAFLQLHVYQQAIDDAEVAVAQDARNAKAWARLGSAHQAAGHLREARDVFFQAAELDDNVDYRLMLDHAEKALFRHVTTTSPAAEAPPPTSSAPAPAPAPAAPGSALTSPRTSDGPTTPRGRTTTQSPWNGLQVEVSSIQDSDGADPQHVYSIHHSS